MPNLLASTARRLLIVRTGRALDDLPFWMVRAALAIECYPGGTKLLVDDDPGAPDTRWFADPTLTVDSLVSIDSPLVFGHLGLRILFEDQPHGRDYFVVYGPRHAFNPHRPGGNQ